MVPGKSSSDQVGALDSLLRFPTDTLRAAFKRLNWLMVGMFHLGLGPYVSDSYTGYIMVLATTGRKSGLLRCTPVNFVMGDGKVCCLSGFGRRSDWYESILADPQVQVWIGSEGWMGHAEVIEDPAGVAGPREPRGQPEGEAAGAEGPAFLGRMVPQVDSGCRIDAVISPNA